METLIPLTVAMVIIVLACIAVAVLVSSGARRHAPASEDQIPLRQAPIRLVLFVDAEAGDWKLVARKAYGAGWWNAVPQSFRVVADFGPEQFPREGVYAAGSWTYDFRWEDEREIAHGPIWDAPISITATAQAGMLGTLETKVDLP